jgi:hypothetical protein
MRRASDILACRSVPVSHERATAGDGVDKPFIPQQPQRTLNGSPSDVIQTAAQAWNKIGEQEAAEARLPAL